MIIETERLLLRPFQEGDAEDVFEYLSEPAVNCFASMKLHSLEEAREEVLKRSSETEYYFAIVLKDSDKVIGEIDAYPEPADEHGADSEMDTFSPCWMLNKAYHGKGYAYEAAYAFFDYIFKDKRARRIYAYTEDYNKSSQHLCEKLGMRQEGLFKEFISFVKNPDGTPHYENTYQYAILKKEWDTIKRVTEMEGIYDQALKIMDNAENSPEELLKFQPELMRLADYYSSQDWKDDFALDEEGKLPQNLKRGVLSEDGVYNLLDRNKELLEEE